jgi:hypothetical protein
MGRETRPALETSDMDRHGMPFRPGDLGNGASYSAPQHFSTVPFGEAKVRWPQHSPAPASARNPADPVKIPGRGLILINAAVIGEITEIIWSIHKKSSVFA